MDSCAHVSTAPWLHPEDVSFGSLARRALLALVAVFALMAISSTSALAADGHAYHVQRGDTLSAIAVRYDTSVSKLVALNSLTNANLLRAGQTIVVTGAAPTHSSIISAPYYDQFDGTIYAASNCGPTAVAMGLGAIGIGANQISLRHLAARQMGFDNPYGGTTWTSLAYAARVRGARVNGLTRGNKYSIWSIDDLQREFAQGHPVILLVRYRGLPDHRTSGYWGDHYIVGLGFDSQGNLVYHDPAFHVGSGAYRTISRGQLLQAWTNTSVGLIRTAMALSR